MSVRKLQLPAPTFSAHDSTGVPEWTDLHDKYLI